MTRIPSSHPFLLGFITWTLVACQEPIDLGISDLNSFLVVDGLITDQPGPYTVSLSVSSPLNVREFQSVEGATVEIEEEGGQVELLKEFNTGVYSTSEGGIQGRAGQQYRLRIRLPEGQEYESEWVSLKPAPPIEEVYFRLEQRERIDTRLERGAQIYLSTRDPSQSTRFYRWEWEATFLHVAPFSSGLEFQGNDIAEFVGSNQVCYNSTFSDRIYLASSVENTTDQISDFPLVYVSGFGQELLYRYSILVKQYALSEKEYLFWSALEEANENSGTFYDRQPQSTTGNVFRIGAPEERVLGYFSASGVSQKRLFIDRTELPRDMNVGLNYIFGCFNQADTLTKERETDQDVFNAVLGGRKFYDFLRNDDTGILGWIMVTCECSDCTEQGGTTVQPEFWEE